MVDVVDGQLLLLPQIFRFRLCVGVRLRHASTPTIALQWKFHSVEYYFFVSCCSVHTHTVVRRFRTEKWIYGRRHTQNKRKRKRWRRRRRRDRGKTACTRLKSLHRRQQEKEVEFSMANSTLRFAFVWEIRKHILFFFYFCPFVFRNTHAEDEI